MSVKIVRKPFAVEFIKNNLEFVFKGDNIEMDGWGSIHLLQFTVEPQPGAVFTLTINGVSFQYKVSSVWSDDIFTLHSAGGELNLDNWEDKLHAIPFIDNRFDTTTTRVPGVGFRIYFTAKQYGTNDFSLTQNSGPVFNGEAKISTTGRPRRFREDYKIGVTFNFEYTNAGYIVKESSPEIMLDADEDGYATLPCNILKKLSKDIDTPASFTTQYSAKILNRLLIKYSIELYEMWGGIIRDIKESVIFLGINGYNSTSGSKINKPDWQDIYYNLTLSHCPYIRLFGCDNNLTIQSHRNGKDYLYLCLFDTSKPTTYSKTLKGRINYSFTNGFKGDTIILPDIVVQNYSIQRIPVYLNAFAPLQNKEQILSYRIDLWNEDKSEDMMVRTFVLSQPNYFMHEFLLQNKYGVLEYFFTDTQKVESVVKADEIVIENSNDIDITQRNKLFTVNTGIKNYKQLKLIEQAAYSEHNYIIIKNKLVPIYIVPESIPLLDEDKDLQTASFKFRYKDDDTEEVAIQNALDILPYEETVDPTHDHWADEYYIGGEGGGATRAASWEDKDKINEPNTKNLWI